MYRSGWTLTLTLIGLGYSLLRTSAQPIYTPYAFTNFAGQPGIVGAADGIGDAVGFNLPHGIAADNAGNLYVSDTFNQTIRKSHFGDNFGRRSSQVAERFSLELDLNLIGLHLERAAQERLDALFNRRTYLSNDTPAQVTHQAFQSSFDQSAKQFPEQGGIGQHHDLSALSIPNLPIAQAATAQHRLKE